MFNVPTVFVIGAGASAEFGMPVGSALMSSIAAAVNFGPDGKIGDDALLTRMRDCLNADKVDTLVKQGPRLATTVSRFVSMDEVLHFLSREPDIIELGKMAIGYEIIKSERNSILYGALNGNKNAIDKCERTWADLFIRLALSASRRQELTKIFEKVTVIDFNYDRVLPQFLFWSLQRSLEASSAEAAECVGNLTILHPYGSIGPLVGVTSTESVPFGADDVNICDIAKRIRTYTEENSDPQLDQIKRSIESARLMIVLGFGYHRQNIQILTHTGEWKRGDKMFLTMHGIDSVNHMDIVNQIMTAVRTTDYPKWSSDKAEQMLRNYAISISLAAS